VGTVVVGKCTTPLRDQLLLASSWDSRVQRLWLGRVARGTWSSRVKGKEGSEEEVSARLIELPIHVSTRLLMDAQLALLLLRK
jgi:hypothetical protein